MLLRALLIAAVLATAACNSIPNKPPPVEFVK